MTEPDPDRFAALVCDWCLEVGAGQQVLISSTTLAQAPALALHRAILDRDAWPLLRLTPPALAEDFYRHARPRHLSGFAPLELTETRDADAFVRIHAPGNTRSLGRHPTRTRGRGRPRPGTGSGGAPGPALVLDAVADCRRSPRRRGWASTSTPRSSPERCSSTGPIPWARGRSSAAIQARLVERLAGAHEIHIEAEGTDLRLDVGGRTWINSDGRRNMPSGEVFTGPHERSANGTIRFTVPSSPGGVEVSGIELRFRDGEVVSARAERGDGYLRAALATDAGARYLGELGIGTNRGIDRATGMILLDEKMAGTVHLALGRSYPETGGTNASALHWDMICDLREGGQISADGEALSPPGTESPRAVE